MVHGWMCGLHCITVLNPAKCEIFGDNLAHGIFFAVCERQ